MGNINWTSVHTSLQDMLASMYLDPVSAQRIVDEAGIDPKLIKFSSIAADNWYQIIREADSQEMLIMLVEKAIGEHKANETLKDLLKSLKEQASTIKVTPGERLVQQDEVDGINLPRVQKEGGYVIDEPPVNWIVEEITLNDLISKGLGASLDKIANRCQFADADLLDKRYILWVSSQSQLKIEYDPGTSLVNGRPTLWLMPETIPVALLKIIPLERNSNPPAFMRQSLEHNFVSQLTTFLQIANLKSSFVGTTKNTKRLRLTAEFDQKIENVNVDGKSNQSFIANHTLIGIQGFLRDYILILSYVSQATSNKAEIESQVALLQSLVDSFKLIKPTNLEEEERRSQQAGDQRYQKYVELNAKQLMTLQFNLLIAQWRELDWEKDESKQRLIKDVKRYMKAMEVFTSGDDQLAEYTGMFDELRNMSLGEMKAFFAPKDTPET
jgi:hypothetical protein